MDHGVARRASRRRSSQTAPSPTSLFHSPQPASSSQVPVVAVRRILSKVSVLPPPPSSDSSKSTASQPTVILAPRRVLQAKPQHHLVPLNIMDGLLRLDRNIETGLNNDSSCRKCIGVVGGESVGKSKLLSGIASALAPLLSTLFATQTETSLANWTPVTSGIDAIFAPNAVFVDSQPLNAISLIASMMSSSAQLPSFYKSPIHATVIQSVELTMLMISVCDVVFVAQDTFASDATLQSVATAAMMIRASSGESQSRARPIFIYSEVSDDDFTRERWEKVQAHLRLCLDVDAFPASTQPICNDLLVASQRHALDLFFIPRASSDPIYTICMQELHAKIANLVLSATGSTFSHAAWFRSCCRTWEAIRASKVLATYNKVLLSQQIE